MYNECRSEFSANDKAAQHVADLLGVGSYDSIMKWVRVQNYIDYSI